MSNPVVCTHCGTTYDLAPVILADPKTLANWFAECRACHKWFRMDGVALPVEPDVIPEGELF